MWRRAVNQWQELAGVGTGLAALAGTTAFCLFAPLIGDRFVPVSVRLATAGVLTGCGWMSGMQPACRLVSSGSFPFSPILFSLAGGLLTALVLRTVWTVLGVGGHLAAITSGLGLAEALTPGSDAGQPMMENASGPVSLLIWVIGVGAFLVSGADMVLWQAAMSAGSVTSVSEATSWSQWVGPLTGLLTKSALAGAMLAGPALVAWALIEVTLGLAGRVYPLPDGWVMALPLRTGVGLLLLAVFTGWMWRAAGPIWLRLLEEAGRKGGLPT